MKNNKTTFNKNELRFGAVKEFNGFSGNFASLIFKTYVVYYNDENGMCVNAVNPEKVYKKYSRIAGKHVAKDIEIGSLFVEGVTDDINVLSHTFHGKKEITVEEIEDAIINSSFSFEDSEAIIEKRANLADKPKVKRKIRI